jgi:hypothetical protein
MVHKVTAGRQKIGPELRVAFWNIERGPQFDLITMALTNAAKIRADRC